MIDMAYRPLGMINPAPALAVAGLASGEIFDLSAEIPPAGGPRSRIPD